MDNSKDSGFILPRSLIRRLILRYHDLPVLWNREHPHYKDKRRRHEAMSKLTELLREHDKSATNVHVLRKIESLRACVRREYRKVVESRSKATTPDELYTPSLWYYDIFSFAFDSGGGDAKALYLDESNAEESGEEVLFENTESPHEMQICPQLEFTNVSDTSRPYKRTSSHVDDEYAIGINVAAKLRALPENMRIISEKLINDVLFQARINGLSASTVISTPDPFKEDQKKINDTPISQRDCRHVV